MARERIRGPVVFAWLAAVMIAFSAVIGLSSAQAADPKASHVKPAPSRVPAWRQLRPDQQRILAPLREDWENLEPQRKLKWVEISNRYHKLGSDEQARIQRRMKAWASLTPDQRRAARDFYRDIEKLPPEKKQEVRHKWEEYQQFTEGQKQQYAARQKPMEDQAAAQDSH